MKPHKIEVLEETIEKEAGDSPWNGGDYGWKKQKKRAVLEDGKEVVYEKSVTTREAFDRDLEQAIAILPNGQVAIVDELERDMARWSRPEETYGMPAWDDPGAVDNDIPCVWHIRTVEGSRPSYSFIVGAEIEVLDSTSTGGFNFVSNQLPQVWGGARIAQSDR